MFDLLPSFVVFVGAAAIAAGMTPVAAIANTTGGIMVRMIVTIGCVVFCLVYIPDILDARKMKGAN